jgi:hypothetical protein
LTPSRSIREILVTPEATGDEFAYIEAQPVFTLLRYLRPGRRWISRAGAVYATLLTIGILVVLFWGLSKKVGSFFLEIAGPYHVIWGAAALVLVLLGALRYSTLQGFVSFTEPDCMMLLSAPIRRADLVWHRLRGVVLLASAGGAAVGMIAAVISHGRAVGGLRLVEAAVSGFAFGLVLIAGSWHVQRLGWASKWVLRLTVPAVGLAVLVAWASRWGGAARTAALWSGPWGWGLLSTGGKNIGWDLGGLLLLCALAAAGLLSLRWSAGRCSIEGFRMRARTRSEVVAGLYAFDVRPIVVAGRQLRTLRWQRRIRLRAPRRKFFAVPWHTVAGLLRSPVRLGWGVALAGAGMALLVFHPGRTGFIWSGAVVLYFSASSLLEPLRMEVDASAASLVLLPWSRGTTLWRHCLVPAGVIAVSGILTVAVAYATGYASGVAFVSAAVLAVPVAFVAVLTAGLSARRGSRVSTNLLTFTAGDTQGFSLLIIVFWIFGWAILGIVTVGLFAGQLSSRLSLAPRLVFGAALLGVLAMVLQRAILAPPKENDFLGRAAANRSK